VKTLFERMSEAQAEVLAVYVGGETLARLRRISAIDGRKPEDLALQAIENAAADDMRGDSLRPA
jgi:hypothetical protein